MIIATIRLAASKSLGGETIVGLSEDARILVRRERIVIQLRSKTMSDVWHDWREVKAISFDVCNREGGTK